MKGSIHSDQTCPICGTRFKSVEPRGLFCPNHPKQSPAKFKVIFGKITRRFDNYPAALQFLTGLRFQDGSGTFDSRDFMAKSAPLAFDRLAAEWLSLKAKQVRSASLRPLNQAVKHGLSTWAGTNIKNIGYAQVEDFLNGLTLAPKTKKNILDALKQFWTWAVDRYDIPPLRKWPQLGHIEMKFRKTISLQDQELVLAEIHKNAKYRVWLAIKWLMTYINIRPGEMVTLKEGDIDRCRGLLVFQPENTKEAKSKTVLLLDEDRELLNDLPLAFPNMPFFRHEKGHYAGRHFSVKMLWYSWLKACQRLGIEGVDLYGGTKHSTAMGLREAGAVTYEEVRKMTGHTTNRAFDRYLRLEGDTLKNLYGQRKKLTKNADNGLTTGKIIVKEQKNN